MRKQYIATECAGMIRIAHMAADDEDAIMESWGFKGAGIRVIARDTTRPGINKKVRQHVVDRTGKIRAEDVSARTATTACYEGRHDDCLNSVLMGDTNIRYERCTCPCHHRHTPEER
jgi:hypothetical protein